MKMLMLAVVLATVSCCMAQIPYLGSCPKVSVVEDFDVPKYLGKWFEQERYFAIFEFGGKCVTANYSLGDNGTVTVINSMINSLTGSKSSIKGRAVPVNPEEPSKLTVSFPNVPDGSYWVLGTDYENYTVVWSCTSYGIFNARFSWILTRERQPSVEIMQNAYQVIAKNGISRTFYLKTDQKNCPSDY